MHLEFSFEEIFVVLTIEETFCHKVLCKHSKESKMENIHSSMKTRKYLTIHWPLSYSFDVLRLGRGRLDFENLLNFEKAFLVMCWEGAKIEFSNPLQNSILTPPNVMNQSTKEPPK